ncbi:MAG: DPP IV N-terminal domain-containing protein [Acidobacteriaceae bacterium]|nr:DPP IV N-terminal domain-containing protein [Acidobacteriaceae bacterium]
MAQAPAQQAVMDQPDFTSNFAWSPDGSRIAWVQTSGPGESAAKLWSADVKSGHRHVLASICSPADHPGLPVLPVIRSYQWAPRGDALLITSNTTLLWLNLKQHTVRTLVSGGRAIFDGQISPDGRWISFVRDNNLWVASVKGSGVKAVTKNPSAKILEGEPDWLYQEAFSLRHAYWWAPDSSAIALLEIDHSKQPASRPGFYPRVGDPIPVVRVLIAHLDGQPVSTVNTVTREGYIVRVNWMPDSSRLALQWLNRSQTMLDLIIADTTTVESHTVIQERDDYWINVSDDLYFFKDAERFIWSSERSGYRQLYLYDVQGKLLRQLTNGSWEVSSLTGVDEKASEIYFTATRASPLERQLYRTSLTGSEPVRVTGPDGWHLVSLSPNAQSFADICSSAMSAPTRSLFRTDGQVISSLDGGSASYSAPPSPVHFINIQAHDGVSLNAEMIRPPDFTATRTYPVILWMAGGPHEQAVRNAWGGALFLWQEAMARKGFIIFAVDNRGSGGHGHLFEEPIHCRLGAQEISDQRDAIQYLRGLPYIDSSRIGVAGMQYGAQLALHALFEDPEDFKAGVAISPIVDWRLYNAAYTERYIGLAQNHAEEYDESSPLEAASKLRGKLLIVAIAEDKAVDPANISELFSELGNAARQASLKQVERLDGTALDSATDFFIHNLQGR